ncbi:MAG: hypothetical protein LBN95_09675 [Prevotellaceae bacterium]|jgi:hypothetical protein|nr:hypothetical protein [Prevotellaceae bacterium]
MEEKTPLSFRAIFGVIMIIVYIGMAYMMVFTKIFNNLSLPLRIVFAILFAAYGIFRAYRLWKTKN